MSEDHRTKEDALLKRRELAGRWLSIETIKRRERTEDTRPIRLDGRIVRYWMSDIRRIEREGCGH